MRRVVVSLLLAGCVPEPPTVTRVSPDLVCDEAEGGVEVGIAGAGFATIVVDAVGDDPTIRPPEVILHPAGGLGEGQPAEATSAVTLGGDRVVAASAEALTLTIDGAAGLVPGAWDVEVVNPDQRRGRLDAGLLIAGPPSLDRLDPLGVCQRAESVDLRIRGAGLLRIGEALPAVRVGELEAEVLALEDCTPLAGGRDGEVCETLLVRVVPTTLALGVAPLSVDNPAPASCGTQGLELEVLRPSTVTEVSPSDVCQVDDRFVLRGTELLEGTVVRLGGYEATTESVDRTTLWVTPAPETPPGRYDVEVVPPQGCPLTITDAVTVHAPPVVFAVDPPSVAAGRGTTVTAWTSDIIREVEDVWLEAPDGARVDVAWTWAPERAAEIRLTVPPGAGAGSHVVHVAQASSCASVPAATIDVVVDPAIALEAVDPGFVWAYAPTPVQIVAQAPTPAGTDPLADPPAFWLIGPDDASETIGLLGVDLRSGTLATAVLPEGLEPGAYTLLARNPDGAIGLLPDAVVVGTDPPPAVEGVAPATLANRVGATLTITGRDFRDPAVRLTCREGGTETTVTGTVVEASWGRIVAGVPAERFGAATCVVEVENADGTSIRWAGVSITNPAQNLFPWRTGEPLVQARRAPAAVAGRTTSVSRWVYAIGGDDGDPGGATASVERAPVGVYGDVGTWEVLPGALPAARTLSGVVRIGSFLYLVAGSDGAQPVNTLWRARILDPLRVPRFDELSVEATTGGLEAGTWRYRVAAVQPPDDPSNPGGESLPGEPIVLTLPEGIAPTVRWHPVEGAAGYRVYRTAAADDPGGTEGLLAEVTEPVFTDLGDGSVDTTVGPLPQGALGAWHPVSSLGTAREAPCVVAAPDPFPDPERWWIYAAGGRDAAGRPLSSVEVVDVEIRGPDRQIVGAWTDAGVSLSEARWSCGAWSVDDRLHTVIEPGEAWIYFGGGEGVRGVRGTVDAGRVGRGGTLEVWATQTSLRPARAGFAVLSASDFLYAFGGSQGRPSTTGTSADLRGAFPDVENWNSLGTSLSTGRYLPGSARESAVVFVVGGASDGAGATRTVDWTNW